MTETANVPALVQRYGDNFTSLLPTHVVGSQWLATVDGLLKSRPEILEAAQNNPGKFLMALLNSARLGLEPGTEQFYLVPQSPRRGEPREILGVVGYQGVVELIYRAGAVSSVIVENVHESDSFTYSPGVHERPIHAIDWTSGDRGPLMLVYAYAIMRDGATSKVVVLNKADIARAKASSASASSDYSPWVKHAGSMWMKTAARQLAKWVPTSAEYRRQQLRDAQTTVNDVAARELARPDLPALPVSPVAEGEYVDELTGEVMVDAELVDTETGEVLT